MVDATEILSHAAMQPFDLEKEETEMRPLTQEEIMFAWVAECACKDTLKLPAPKVFSFLTKSGFVQ